MKIELGFLLTSIALSLSKKTSYDFYVILIILLL
jgi:hypothetical protein